MLNSITKQQARGALILARENRKRGVMASSAQVCVEDAAHLYGKGDFDFAFKAACRSLTYSVGVFSPAYNEARKLVFG